MKIQGFRWLVALYAQTFVVYFLIHLQTVNVQQKSSKNKSEIASSASKNYRLPVYVFVHFQVAGKSSPEIIGIFLLAWVPLSLHRFLVQSCKSINRQQKERSTVRWKKCLCFSSDQGTLSLWILPGQIFSHTIRRSTAVKVGILLLRQV